MMFFSALISYDSSTDFYSVSSCNFAFIEVISYCYEDSDAYNEVFWAFNY